MDSRADAPAPDSRRGFLAAGRSSVSEWSSSVFLGRVGSPIAIFFGAFLAFGGGSDSPDGPLDEDAVALLGGGREKVDFFVGGSLESNEEPCEAGAVCGIDSESLPPSLSLP